MKKHKIKIITAVFIVAVLGVVFWWGGNSPSLRGWNPEKNAEEVHEKISESDIKENTQMPVQEADLKADDELQQNEHKTKPAQNSESENTKTEQKSIGNSAASTQMQGGTDQYKTEAVPDGKPVPKEPQNSAVTNTQHTCTLSVRCDTIVKNISWLVPEKADLVPKDGIVLSELQVTFYEGESVFNLLKRELKKNKIHLEFVNTPVYNSAYIEGIANLYEFDCGERSGWMYMVNGWFPNYGCSRYQLKDGDKVEWVYTCDLGKDVGGFFESGESQKDE